MRKASGFTLIELMMVVAIIAVLATIAMQAWGLFTARSQVTAGVAEIAPGRIPFEVLLHEGKTDFDHEALGLAASTERCEVSVTAGEAGSITCLLKGERRVAGFVVRMARQVGGAWSCETTVENPRLVPEHCRAS